MTGSTPEQPQSWPGRGGGGFSSSWQIGPATVVLIGISVVVALATNLGSSIRILRYLFITDISDASIGSPFLEIIHGQVWRLLTPIFIHFGIPHLLFNMLWLKDLGSAIERRAGTPLFLALVVAIGILSNLGQFLVFGPLFGGMSGVVYGLFGFVWMKAKFDPAAGFLMPGRTVVIMIGWFFLCLSGVLGPLLGSVANVAHGVGLVVGVAWGFISAKAPGMRS